MPELKADLEGAEAKLTQYQEANETIDLGKEGQALLDQVVSVEDKRSQLELKLAELKQTYTGKHPALEAARDQMRQLAQEKKQLEERIAKRLLIALSKPNTRDALPGVSVNDSNREVFIFRENRRQRQCGRRFSATTLG